MLWRRTEFVERQGYAIIIKAEPTASHFKTPSDGPGIGTAACHAPAKGSVVFLTLTGLAYQ